MAATILWRRLGEQMLDADGNPLAGGKVKYERAGTSTLLGTWSDAGATTPNTQTANRIILDSAGRFTEPVYLDDTFDAKETLYTSADVVVSPWPFDNIPKAVDLGASLSDFAKPTTEWAIDTAATVNLAVSDMGKGRLASSGSNSITYNAPSSSQAGNGRGITIKKISASNTVTFEPPGSETVDGAANFSWTGDDIAYKFTPDGANWQVEMDFIPRPVLAAMLPGLMNVQVFTTSGTYTPTAGMVKCIVISTGGGGGGGGADSDGGSNGAGAGGGGGATAIELFTAAQIGASQTVTIGAAGTGGAVTGGDGGNGGNTTFGALHTAGGGSGGGGVASTTAQHQTFGGAGGTASGGLLNIPGGPGEWGGSSSNEVVSGAGGSSFWGSGAAGLIIPAGVNAFGGSAAAVFGCGGSGAVNVDTTAGALGGNGAPGVCLVIEFGAN